MFISTRSFEEMRQDDVNLIRSGSFDTGYGGLDDATSGEGR